MKRRHRRTSKSRRSLENLEPRRLLAADVYISEFLASNDGIGLDEDGDDSDWVEIFNAGPDDVDLDGWHLTDDDAELDKWSFPATILPAGNSILVFASDKDRSEAGLELHTNFKLSAGGEYLALTKDVGNGVDVVSSFAPEFPQQATDISYGVTQEVSTHQVFDPSAATSLLIPSTEPSASWNTIEFADDGWDAVTAAIGYQSTVPGFTVQDAKSTGRIQNISESLALLSGTGQASQTISVTPVVNFVDTGGTGNFQNDLRFPNDTSSDDNDFAIRATGTIIVTQAGTYTFGTNSDDGVRVRIDGRNVINDDTLHAPQDRFGSVDLTEGPHELELIFFERGGGAEVELFAARGTRTQFSSAFDLVGDVANGGLEVVTSSTAGFVGFNNVVKTDVSEMQGEASSAYLRIPFHLDDASVHESLTLGVKYNAGFVAYLNGTEVVRNNVDGAPRFDSVATANRPQRLALTTEFFSITDHLPLLQNGENLLAIHAVNAAADSDEFLLTAELAEIETTAGEAVFFRTPTPGSFNPAQGAVDFLLNDVVISQSHGFYEQPFDVTLTSKTAGTTIRYTLDGSLPTESNGTDYTAPIRVSGTTTLRARSFKVDVEPSLPETATYLFLDDVLQQSPTGRAPEGWPTSRTINGQTLNYGMDPDIVDHATWGPQLKDALTQIPTMSVVMDIDDFIGSQGFYTNANSHGKAWERPASLELIHPDGSEGFQVEMGIRVRGGFSRRGSNPKHAFRLFFRDEYGDAKLEYPLFGEEGAEEFDKVDLRTTQNYSWSFRGSNRNAFVRDVFSRDVQGLMGQPYTRSRFYHLYINGQYWGLFQTQERAEARYAASYFGGNSDDYDVVKSAGSSGGYQNEATDGTLDAYRRLSEFFYQPGGLGDENMDDYWKAQGMNPDGSRNAEFERLLDVDNIISYMILTYFTSDADGPGSKFTRPRVNNYFGIFNRVEPDGFKFFEHDSEHSLDTGNAAGANYDMVSPLTTGGSQFRYFNPHWMHEQLANENSVYRERFADAIYRAMYHDGLLSPDVAKSLIDSRASEFDMAIIAESARWGDSIRSTPYTKTHWVDAVERVKGFFDGRAETVISQIRRYNWFPDTFPPQFYVNGDAQHGGEVSPSDEIHFEIGDPVEYETVLRRGASWSYLDDGSNQGTAWRNPEFDDADWESGRAQLGYGDSDERTVIGYGPNASNKYRTTYFRRSFEVDEQLDSYTLGRIQLLRDDGAIVYLNGQEIVRSNMPAGNVNYLTFAASTVGGGSEDTFFDYEFPLDALQQGTNVLAVEVHQTNASSSDISFDLELELGRRDSVQTSLFYTLDGTDPKLASGDLAATAMEWDGQSLHLQGDTQLAVRAIDNNGVWSVLNVANFVVDGVVPGDFNGDAKVDASDIDALVAAIRMNSDNPAFDLDKNDVINDSDLTVLVEDILLTRRGDINLDRKIDFSDFLLLSANYGALQAGWGQGNMTLDDRVSFQDLLVVSANYGFGVDAALAAFDLADDEV